MLAPDQLGPEGRHAGQLDLDDVADLPLHVFERGTGGQDHLNAGRRPIHRLAERTTMCT